MLSQIFMRLKFTGMSSLALGRDGCNCTPFGSDVACHSDLLLLRSIRFPQREVSAGAKTERSIRLPARPNTLSNGLFRK